MALNKVKIGSFIEQYKEKCNIPNLTVNDISGINRNKEFFEPSKQAGADTTKYKIVPPHYFACNLMHVGRDKVLPISINHTNKNKIVSPAYTVFRIIDETFILEDYFFIFLKSDETDRFFWFNTDSSIRDGLDWNAFCDIEISVPSLDIQRKYVRVYKALKRNLSDYQSKNEELRFLCEVYVNELKKDIESIPIGQHIITVDERNTELAITKALGVNIEKKLMPTIANVGEDDIGKYKIIRKNEFVFSGMQTGRDRVIRIALNRDEDAVVSPAYTVFKVDDSKLTPGYFMMWFTRPECDRQGWFVSDGSIRDNMDWDRFIEMKIPCPSLKIQNDIVKIFDAYTKRENIIESLKNRMDSICPILIKGAVEEGGRI